MSNSGMGRYTGKLIFEPLPDGRRMRVVEDFGFMEADGLHWPVPPRSVVDGASIPGALWSLIGGPFEGKYRDASVVHDYYCAVRSADWQSVHRMFYRAMLVSEVSVRLAKLMYAAVYFAGPRWDDMVVENVTLGSPAIPSRRSEDTRLFSVNHDPLTLDIGKAIGRDGISALDWCTRGRMTADPSAEITLQLDKLVEIVDRTDPSLRNLEKAIDEVVGFIPDVDGAPRGVFVGHLAALG